MPDAIMYVVCVVRITEFSVCIRRVSYMEYAWLDTLLAPGTAVD